MASSKEDFKIVMDVLGGLLTFAIGACLTILVAGWWLFMIPVVSWRGMAVVLLACVWHQVRRKRE
jgi:CHASE2 domain-containing sensor protein